MSSIPPADLYQSQRPQTLGVIIPFAVLAIVAVVLRLWAKALVKPRYGADDYLIIAGLVRLPPLFPP
jgi:hypothetical protein